MMKQIFSASKIVTLAVVLSFGLSYVYAWTTPTATPPTGNVSAPINTGDNTQYKAGNLVLNDSVAPFVNGLIVRYGNVGIGTNAPAQKLSVAGTIESTTGGIKFPDGTTQSTAIPSGIHGGTCNGADSPTYPALSCTKWVCGYNFGYWCWGINACAPGWTKRYIGGDPWDNANVYACVKD